MSSSATSTRTHAHDYYTDHLWRFDPRDRLRWPDDLPGKPGGRKGLYIHDLFTKAALNFIEINKPDSSSMAIAHSSSSSPTPFRTPTTRKAARSGNGMEVPSDAPYSNEPWPQDREEQSRHDHPDGWRYRPAHGSPHQKLKHRREYHSSCSPATTARTRKAASTRNSSKVPAPLRGIKRDLYEGGIRVPIIAHWPAKIKPGQVSDSPCGLLGFPAHRRRHRARTKAPEKHRRHFLPPHAAWPAADQPARLLSIGSFTSAASNRPRAWATGKRSGLTRQTSGAVQSKERYLRET